MKTFCTLIFITAVFCLFSCNADPGIISDDDTMPTLPADSLVCDTLPAPNQFFSDAIGAVVVFTDSLGDETDTLVCTDNFAIEVEAMFNGNRYCQAQYTTGFMTSWMPAPDVYSIVFKDNLLPNLSLLTAYSSPFEDFEASEELSSTVIGVYEDDLDINGKVFHQVFQYNCKPSATCTFAEAFVFSQNQGLVAIKRNGKWWTKK
jgi:hypothetical protein